MSSTNRGSYRAESDNYVTPFWCTHCLLDRLFLPKDGIWFEPCAGNGAIIQALNVRGESRYWWANELRQEESPRLMVSLPRCGVLTIGNILDPSANLPPREEVTVVLTNPPYSLAWELLHKMLTEFPRAYVVFLLRLNFYASKSRHSFLSKYAPDLYVLPNRPGFQKWGKTDSSEYAWFVWPPCPRSRTSGRHELLGLTPVAERKEVAEPTSVDPSRM